MSSTRLRKAFRYPNEGSDDDETFQDLDEEGTTPIPSIGGTRY